jgi:hypothetical protein
LLIAQGFLAFIATVACHLEYDDPVGMAFLSHILDRCSLPARSTMNYVSPIIVNKLHKKPGRIRRLISVAYNRCKLERTASKREEIRKKITLGEVGTDMESLQNPRQTNMKRNAASLWAILSSKFAGEMATLLWRDDVRNMLMRSVANTQEDLAVRTFSLVALEKFAATRKFFILIMTEKKKIEKNLF